MSMTFEQFELMFTIGMVVAIVGGFLLVGTAFLIAAKKAKKNGSKDAKIWKGFGIGFMILAGVMLLGVGGTILLVELLKAIDPAAVLVL